MNSRLNLIRNVFSELGFLTSHCSLESLQAINPGYSRLAEHFGESRVVKYLKTFPDLFVSHKRIQLGTFHAKLCYGKEATLQFQAQYAEHHQPLSASTLILEYNDDDSSLFTKTMWVDQPYSCKLLTETLCRKLPHRISESEIAAVIAKHNLRI